MSILLIGNNCGISKLKLQKETGNPIIEEEEFIKIIKGDYKLDTYLYKFYNKYCPKCNNTNIKINKNKTVSSFWGCYECNYGWWEKYLPDKHIKKFCIENELKYQPQRYIEFTKKIKKKKSNSDNSKQLTLF